MSAPDTFGVHKQFSGCLGPARERAKELASEIRFDIVGHVLDDKSNDAGIIEHRRNK
jgi:hypothetical protein